MDKYLIIGLGNPGQKYENTKHNSGFIALDFFAKQNKFNFDSNIFEGNFYKLKYDEKEVFFLKPQTFMNLSGECVLKFINFYKINFKNILVVYDDLDLPIGKIKLKKNGSSGGQNGIKDIINKLGTEDIKRIKIGIGRPKNKNDSITNYVLSKFSSEDQTIFLKSIERASKIIGNFYQKDFDKILMEMNND
ncbi:MAG: aminoacyl-tRNA hydrolase [Mycoplasmoidaceae bacterium]